MSRKPNAPQQEEWSEELLAFHEAFVGAHVENRPEFMVEGRSPDYVNVSRGELLRQTDAEIRAQFTDYLGNTTFSEYRMLEGPILGFSRDGSISWSIFRLKVAGTRRLADSEEVSFDTVWACLFLFERRGDRWIRIAEASNHTP